LKQALSCVDPLVGEPPFIREQTQVVRGKPLSRVIRRFF
jgi:hypothetical protein